jgi:hypothetical protein
LSSESRHTLTQTVGADKNIGRFKPLYDTPRSSGAKVIRLPLRDLSLDIAGDFSSPARTLRTRRGSSASLANRRATHCSRVTDGIRGCRSAGAIRASEAHLQADDAILNSKCHHPRRERRQQQRNGDDKLPHAES